MRRRTFVATTAGLGTAMLAGCNSSGDGTDDSGSDDGGTDAPGVTTGTFRLLISDRPSAIEDFDSLEVTLSSARVFRAGDDETSTGQTVTETPNGSESTATGTPGDGTEMAASTGSATEMATTTTDTGDGGGFVEFDLDDETVDLTEVVGDRAVSVLEDELDEGRYSGIELGVASAGGVVDGEDVDVMVPSDKLRIVRPFEIAPDAELSFVFDIEVVQKGPGGSYNLLPVIGKSGVTGEDVDVEEVDGETDDGSETPSATPTSAGDGGDGS